MEIVDNDPGGRSGDDGQGAETSAGTSRAMDRLDAFLASVSPSASAPTSPLTPTSTRSSRVASSAKRNLNRSNSAIEDEKAIVRAVQVALKERGGSSL